MKKFQMGKITCGLCHKKCQGKVLKFYAKYYHHACFRCKVCNSEMDDRGFFQKSDGFYCPDHFKPPSVASSQPPPPPHQSSSKTQTNAKSQPTQQLQPSSPPTSSLSSSSATKAAAEKDAKLNGVQTTKKPPTQENPVESVELQMPQAQPCKLNGETSKSSFAPQTAAGLAVRRGGGASTLPTSSGRASATGMTQRGVTSSPFAFGQHLNQSYLSLAKRQHAHPQPYHPLLTQHHTHTQPPPTHSANYVWPGTTSFRNSASRSELSSQTAALYGSQHFHTPEAVLIGQNQPWMTRSMIIPTVNKQSQQRVSTNRMSYLMSGSSPKSKAVATNQNSAHHQQQQNHKKLRLVEGQPLDSATLKRFSSYPDACPPEQSEPARIERDDWPAPAAASVTWYASNAGVTPKILPRQAAAPPLAVPLPGNNTASLVASSLHTNAQLQRELDYFDPIAASRSPAADNPHLPSAAFQVFHCGSAIEMNGSGKFFSSCENVNNRATSPAMKQTGVHRQIHEYDEEDDELRKEFEEDENGGAAIRTGKASDQLASLAYRSLQCLPSAVSKHDLSLPPEQRDCRTITLDELKAYVESRRAADQNTTTASQPGGQKRDASNLRVDRTRLEVYLTDREFKTAFALNRKIFYSLPEWKRTDLKMKAGLF